VHTTLSDSVHNSNHHASSPRDAKREARQQHDSRQGCVHAIGLVDAFHLPVNHMARGTKAKKHHRALTLLCFPSETHTKHLFAFIALPSETHEDSESSYNDGHAIDA
jgi:hypothetical protein